MDGRAVRALAEINRRFYARQARAFSASRRRLQPGARRVLEGLRVEPDGTWLDLGCGNGWLGHEWVQQNMPGSYVGLDFSAELLAEARALNNHPAVSFRQADFMQARWSEEMQDGIYQGAFCFAVLHHLPSFALRVDFLRQASALLEPGGWLWLSAWAFLREEKWRERIQDWSLAGLSAADLEEGDYLLDWRQTQDGQPALRYVHSFSEGEWDRLFLESGWRAAERFDSDGESGRLSVYFGLRKTS